MPTGDIQSDMFERDIRKVQINGEWHFSIIDIFEHYGSGSTNPKREWQRVKDKLSEQGSDVVPNMVLHQFEGQGQRKTPLASLSAILRIAQVVTFQNWEGLRQWMADLAAREIQGLQEKAMIRHRLYNKLVNEGFTPQEAQQWIDARVELKTSRQEMTDTWRQHGVTGRDFGRLTNEVTEVAVGKTATELKRELGVTSSPRDYLSTAQNVAIKITEFTSRMLHIGRDSAGVDELSDDIQDTRPIIDAARPEIEKAFSKKPRRLKGQNQPPLLEE